MNTWPLPIEIFPPIPYRSCYPAELIRELLATDRLPWFERASSPATYPPDGLGNCHEASLSLLLDLRQAGEVGPWRWARGLVIGSSCRETDHSWLECDGWVLECANGRLVFIDRRLHREVFPARGVKLRDMVATARWVARRGRPRERPAVVGRPGPIGRLP
jgi:hypothetical protein